ncbi:MAG: MBL fold metallo-hydrolase [Acidimicrobiales bacterium]
MPLSLTVLGSAGTYAGPGNACSGYLVGDGTSSVWLDCGPGTLANLQRHVDLADLDAVAVTHSHPDHCLELPLLRNALKYAIGRKDVPVFGPAGTLAVVEAVLGDAVAPTLDWRVVADGSTFAVGDLSFACSRTDHPVETLAVRIESDGRALAYSADTGPGWSFERFGAPIDLALCEATLPPGSEDSLDQVHLSGREAGTIARAAGATRLVLTHLWPTSNPDRHRHDAEATFGAPVEMATVDTRYVL